MVDVAFRQLASHFAARIEQLHQILWKAGANEQTMECDSAGGRYFGRLPDRPVARRKRLRHPHAVEKYRIIPRADNSDDAARTAMDCVALGPKPQRQPSPRHPFRSQQTLGLTFEKP